MVLLWRFSDCLRAVLVCFLLISICGCYLLYVAHSQSWWILDNQATIITEWGSIYLAYDLLVIRLFTSNNLLDLLFSFERFRWCKSRKMLRVCFDFILARGAKNSHCKIIEEKEEKSGEEFEKWIENKLVTVQGWGSGRVRQWPSGRPLQPLTLSRRVHWRMSQKFSLSLWKVNSIKRYL